MSDSNHGVAGVSTSGSGVYGETSVSSLTQAGVYGKGMVSGAIGVTGEANIADYPTSNSITLGTVEFSSPSGLDGALVPSNVGFFMLVF